MSNKQASADHLLTTSVHEAFSCTREDAILFLENAARNWRRLPPLSEDDLTDVASALADFVHQHTRPGPATEKADVVEARSALEAVMTAIRTVDPWWDGEGETLSMNASPQGVENIALRAIKAYEQFAALQSRPTEPAVDKIQAVAEGVANIVGAPYEDWRHFTGEAKAILARLETAAEPAGDEPVAYMVQTDDERWLAWRDDDTPAADCDYKIVPLYARPTPSNPDRLVEAERALNGYRAAVAGEVGELAAEQDKRRLALIERIGTVADLACSKPLEGELGDVAYELLRQAAAQLASDRQQIQRGEAECAALRAEVADLSADKARLDYLDRCNAALNAAHGTTYRWKLIQSHNVNRLMIGDFAVDLHDSEANGMPSCRDAIDERMRGRGDAV